MIAFIGSLVQILLRVTQGSVSIEHNGEFSAGDTIFANKLLQRTIRTATFRTNPTDKTLRSLLTGLCEQDEELCAWAERKMRDLGDALFGTHLWITNKTLGL